MRILALRRHCPDVSTIRAVIAVIAILLALTAVGEGVNYKMNPSAPTAGPITRVIEPSYALGFRTVQAMAAGSNLIAEGVVVSNAYLPNAVPAPSTDYVFDVSRIIANHKGDTMPHQIIMHELGGPQLPSNIKVEDGIAYRDGQHLIVFLREYAPGRYTSIAGPASSAFTVTNGAVAKLVPENDAPQFSGPMPMASFLALLGK